MAELLTVWNSTQLTAGKPPADFSIPNNPNARTLKINNQSRFWLLLKKAQTSVTVDRIEPFSFLIMPAESDISLSIDTSGDQESSLSPDKEFVDYSTIDGFIGYLKGSTQFTGSSTVSIAGSVNIANSQLNVAIQGTPTFNLAPNTSVSISGQPTMNINSMPAVTIGNATLNVKLDQTGGNNTVNIAGTPSVTISGTATMNINSMPAVTFAAGSSVAITGTPTMNINSMPAVTFAAGSTVQISGTPTMNINSMPAVTISNATLKVAIDTTSGNNNVVIQGTPAVTISGTPVMNINSMPAVTIGNATLNVKLDQTGGNNTVNIAGTPSVTISGTATMNINSMPAVTFAAGSSVAITGTPTMNINSMPAVTFAAGSSVQISGTPTMNINSMPSVTLAAGASVTINGTPTMNINSMPAVTISSGTINVNSANATIVNDQLPVTSLYTGKVAMTLPAGASSWSQNFQFLPDGNMIEFHKVFLYISSAIGQTYTMQGISGYCKFADGTQLTSPGNPAYLPQQLGTSKWYSMDITNPMVANIFNLSISLPAVQNQSDTLTIYYQIDANDTSIETPSGAGVPIQASSGLLYDVSGTITTANVSQQIIGSGTITIRYQCFQNLSGADMYINFGHPATAGAGSILVPANGGSFTLDGSFTCNDSLNVICPAAAGGAFTYKYNY